MKTLPSSRYLFASSRYLAAACLVLVSSCSMLPGPSATAAVANACATGASRINPAAALLRGSAQTSAVPPGIADTGQLALRPGIGGTGAPQAIAKGGIGGTGIVGVVTGFASICVNDVEVHYHPSTPVVIDGQTGNVDELAVGQLVVVSASGSAGQPDAQLQAQRIAVLHVAIGPLGSVNTATGQFSVLGQSAVALHKEQLANLRAGDWVRVSGFRLPDGPIRASLVRALAEPLPASRILGPVMAIDRNTVHVGQTPVHFRALPDGLAIGQEIAVSGQWKIDRLEASSSVLQPTLASLGLVTEVLLQGYVHAWRGRELTLGYGLLRLGEQAKLIDGSSEGLAIGRQVLIHGRLGADRQVVVDQLRFVSDRAQADTRGGPGHDVKAGKGAGETGKTGGSSAGDSAGRNGGGPAGNGNGGSGAAPGR